MCVVVGRGAEGAGEMSMILELQGEAWAAELRASGRSVILRWAHKHSRLGRVGFCLNCGDVDGGCG
jgi:hypothetical protein